MADERLYLTRSYACPHGCGGRNAFRASKCGSCDKPIAYDEAAQAAHAAEDHGGLNLQMCLGGCGELNCLGASVYLPEDSEQGFHPANYICRKCLTICPHCQDEDKPLLTSGPGAGKVCKECLVICQEKAESRLAQGLFTHFGDKMIPDAKRMERNLPYRIACGQKVRPFHAKPEIVQLWALLETHGTSYSDDFTLILHGWSRPKRLEPKNTRARVVTSFLFKY